MKWKDPHRAHVRATWLVNSTDIAVDKYCAANATDAFGHNGMNTVYYNEKYPLQQIIVSELAEIDIDAAANAAYYDLFIKTFRLSVVYSNLYNDSKLYSEYKGAIQRSKTSELFHKRALNRRSPPCKMGGN